MTEDRKRELYLAENLLFNLAFPLLPDEWLSYEGRKIILRAREHVIAQIYGNGYWNDGNNKS